MKKILVAGIGNIFHGDDAFGVEVVKRMMQRDQPDAVQVADFGIRSYDLAYALMDGYEATILVDATRQRGEPGTLYLIEPDVSDLERRESAVVNGHSMKLGRALRLVETFGGGFGEDTLYLVGCEPAELEADDGRLGLSETVEAVVLDAIEMIESLIDTLLHEDHIAQPTTSSKQEQR